MPLIRVSFFLIHSLLHTYSYHELNTSYFFVMKHCMEQWVRDNCVCVRESTPVHSTNSMLHKGRWNQLLQRPLYPCRLFWLPTHIHLVITNSMLHKTSCYSVLSTPVNCSGCKHTHTLIHNTHTYVHTHIHARTHAPTQYHKLNVSSNISCCTVPFTSVNMPCSHTHTSHTLHTHIHIIPRTQCVI